MPDRIVQLKDKDDNNIFPVASVANAANIRMTDTDPGEGSPLEAGNYVAVYGQNGYIETADIADEAVVAGKTAFGGNYSLTEQDTGFTWIDGKHIYKKTIYSTVSSRAFDIVHNTTGLETVINAEGMWITSNGSANPINRNAADQPDHGYDVGVGDINATKVWVTLGSSNTIGGTIYVTLYYTKS